LEPKPPPTKRVMTRILVGAMPISAATVSRVAVMPWVES
jgi:hypothetical protein